MDYDFFALYHKSPVYFACKRLTPYQFELTTKAYSKLHFQYTHIPVRLVLISDGKKWGSDPNLYDNEFLQDLTDRVKTWEKNNHGPL